MTTQSNILTDDFHVVGAAGHFAHSIKSLTLVISIIRMLDWVDSHACVTHVKDYCIVGVNKMSVPPPLNPVNRSSHLTVQSEGPIENGWSARVIHLDSL